jgi:hypothetical protein
LSRYSGFRENLDMMRKNFYWNCDLREKLDERESPLRGKSLAEIPEANLVEKQQQKCTFSPRELIKDINSFLLLTRYINIYILKSIAFLDGSLSFSLSFSLSLSSFPSFFSAFEIPYEWRFISFMQIISGIFEWINPAPTKAFCFYTNFRVLFFFFTNVERILRAI